MSNLRAVALRVVGACLAKLIANCEDRGLVGPLGGRPINPEIPPFSAELIDFLADAKLRPWGGVEKPQNSM